MTERSAAVEAAREKVMAQATKFALATNDKAYMTAMKQLTPALDAFEAACRVETLKGVTVCCPHCSVFFEVGPPV